MWAYSRIIVTPLTLPGYQNVESQELRLTGKTIPGARVMVDGQAVAVEPDGSFTISHDFDLTFTGSKTFEVVARTGFRRGTTGSFQVYRSLPRIPLTARASSRVTGERSVVISGQTQSGARLRVNEELVVAGSDGSFQYVHQFPIGFDGDQVFRVAAEHAGYLSTSTSVTVTRKPRASEIQQVFAAGALRAFPYREVLKNASRYVGTKVIFWGKVLQIQEGQGSSFMLVYVTAGSYGLWDDIVVVEYPGTTNFLDKDQIEIYGVIVGDLYSYETKGGWTNSVPQVRATLFGDKFWR